MIYPKRKSLTREERPGEILLTQDAGIAFRLEDPDGKLGALLDLLDGARSIAEIAAELAQRWPDLTEAEVAEGIAGLDEAGLLEAGNAPTTLTPAQQERYFNNLAFFGTFASLQTSRYTFQERLRGARVTLVGAGGVGSTVLLQLAGMGVGRIAVVEFDRVERKNVSRQLLYTEASVGKPKLEQAIARARAINSEVEFEAFECQVTGSADLARLTAGSDLLVLTADTPSAVVDWANEACVPAGIPFITGGIGIARAAYYSVHPGHSGCIGCLRALERERTGTETRPAHPDGIHRGISPAGALVASLIGMEALRYLTGFAPPIAAGRYWQVDLATGATTPALEWPRRPDCPVCGGVAAATRS